MIKTQLCTEVEKDAPWEKLMNVSCGYCQTIRSFSKGPSFSGERLICEECGWVYTDPATRKPAPKETFYPLAPPKSSESSAAEAVGKVLFVLMGLLIVGIGLVVAIAVVKWAFEEIAR